MSRYIKGKDGKFTGSVGAGKANAPTVAPTLRAVPQPAPEPDSDPHGIHAAFSYLSELRARYENEPGCIELSDPNTSAERIDALVREDHPAYDHRWIRAARNPNTSVETQRWLVGRDDEQIMMDLIDTHPDTLDESVQMCIAVRADEAVSAAVHLADSSALTPESARTIRDTNIPKLLSVLAANPRIPADMHRELLNHDDENVRAAAARNPSADRSDLEYRATSDFSAKVREAARAALNA